MKKMIGIRYCGGCNPHYDRKAFVEKVSNHYKDVKEFEIAREGVDYEGLLVIGGCQNCCAAHKQFTTEAKPMLVWGEEFFADIEKYIAKL